MSDDIMKLVNEAMAELDKISKDKDADPALKKKAFDHLENLLLLEGKAVISDFEGRTAVLAGLIEELKTFTQAIKVHNPIATQVTKFTTLVNEATDLFATVKKSG
jgi:hypothetical protein